MNNTNKFVEIISSPMMNTSSIQRYSGTKMAEPENLSTHILESQMMGYMIINHMNKFCNEDLDKGFYLEKALHHDLEESMTGDVVRTLKYHNPDVLRELQSVASDVAEEIYLKYFEDYDKELLYLWETAKKGKEGFILKLVDTLTVVNRVVKEVDFLNNNHFLRVAYEVNIYLEDLVVLVEENPVQYTSESIIYLQEILKGAKDILRRILEDNKELASTYNIIDKSLLKEKEGIN